MFLSLVLVVGMMVFPLGDRALKQARVGQARPSTYPASLKLRTAVKERVATEKNVKVLTVARLGVEPDTGIHILLVSPMEISENLPSELDDIVDSIVGEDIAVRVISVKGIIKDHPVVVK
jgi:hypothetical protein